MYNFPEAPVVDQVYDSWKWRGDAWIKNDAATVPPPVTQPIVDAVSPVAIGFKDPATTMRVTGSNFTAESVIIWDLTPQPTTFVSASELTCPLDPAKANNVKTVIYVSVKTGNVPSALPPKQCLVAINPYTTSIAPTTGPAGADLVIVSTGYMYQTDPPNIGGGSQMTWDGVPVPTVINNATTITGTVPANLVTAGVHQVNCCGGDNQIKHDPAYPDLPFTVT